MFKRVNELKPNDTINFGELKIKIIKNNKLFKNLEILINDKTVKMKYKEFINYISEDYRKILTHNCAQRLVCGKLEIVASRMAVGSSMATTIDGAHKGAGLTKSQGEINHIQYYFDNQSRIVDWYRKRGLTDKGYDPSEDPFAEIDPSTIDLGDDEEIILEDTVTEMKFHDMEVKVDNTKSQKFEEV